MTKEQESEFVKLVEHGIGYNVKYAPGTLEKGRDGKLTLAQPKAKALYQAITNKYTTFITIEGGQRGGKDVYALFAYANYLMTCPDTLHLVTGTTINHAINTVYEANGFGLRYLLPHGKKCEKDARTIFEFTDWYGVRKQVHFYGGEKKGDKNGFQGISYGSHYANEALLQHIDTIKEGANRTTSSRQRKVIHTQNPKGGAFGYYEEYEKDKVAKDDDYEKIYSYKDHYNQYYKDNVDKFRKQRRELLNKITDKFVSSFGLKSADELKNDGEIYKKYIRTCREKTLILDRKWLADSGVEYRMFKDYDENPNGVRNGLYFRYFHFTNKDNLGMTDHDRLIIDETQDKMSLNYRRNVLGIRASSDSAIYPTFTPDNLYNTISINGKDTMRFLAIDFGVKNDFVILDITVDRDFQVYVEKEKRFDAKVERQIPTVDLYVKFVREILNSRLNGKYNAIIVDPSAKIFINDLKVNHFMIMKAKNALGLKDRNIMDKSVNKSLFGIYLVREGFNRNKIHINKSCKTLINEIEGYVFDDKKLALGIEEPYQVHDHGCDALRYLVNTIVKRLERWSERNVQKAVEIN